MINTRSPFYISAPITNPSTTAIELRVYIYSENTGTVPSTPTYRLTKKISSAVPTVLDFEISHLVRDFFKYSPTFNSTTILMSTEPKNVLYVLTELDYIGSPEPTISTIQMAIDGYGYFMEGANPQAPANKVLLANDYYIVNKNGYFNIPVINDGTHTQVKVNDRDYPLIISNVISSKVKNMFMVISDYTDFVTVKVGGRTITLEIQDECKYRPVDVMFMNKYGAWEIMTFFKASKESVQIQKSTFKNNYVSNGSYNVKNHTYQDFNKNGREKLQLNSGFVPESYNETIRQLLLSEHVFLLNNGNHIPVNIETSSYQFKTRIIDKLISHQIDLEYSFDLINNI